MTGVWIVAIIFGFVYLIVKMSLEYHVKIEKIKLEQMYGRRADVIDFTGGEYQEPMRHQ